MYATNENLWLYYFHMKEFPNHYSKCDCSSHLLEIERYYYTDSDKGFQITTWNLDLSTKKLSYLERLRWIWQILTKGTLWTDYVMISDDRAKKLARFIDEHINSK